MEIKLTDNQTAHIYPETKVTIDTTNLILIIEQANIAQQDDYSIIKYTNLDQVLYDYDKIRRTLKHKFDKPYHTQNIENYNTRKL